MEVSRNIWRDRPIVPIYFWCQPLLQRIYGLACGQKNTELITSAYTLNDDGVVTNFPAEEVRLVTATDWLRHHSFRATCFQHLIMLAALPLRRALLQTLSERLWFVHQKFSRSWPKTLNETVSVLWGVELPKSSFALHWRIDDECRSLFPTSKQPLTLIAFDQTQPSVNEHSCKIWITARAAEVLRQNTPLPTRISWVASAA